MWMRNAAGCGYAGPRRRAPRAGVCAASPPAGPAPSTNRLRRGLSTLSLICKAQRGQKGGYCRMRHPGRLNAAARPQSAGGSTPHATGGADGWERKRTWTTGGDHTGSKRVSDSAGSVRGQACLLQRSV
ncbi:hypothetical protein VTN00DRAFT_8280 [Thermoascus crustaceus]|uniref:uncharacterized protein n=1 Tax=Thermoascus crustaceus TaxID=5088 RepID=UPI0037429726